MQHTHLKWLLSQHRGTANKYAGWDSNGNPAELEAPEGGGGVPTSRTISINGISYDLSANRSWTVGDLLASGSYSNPTWIVSLAWSKITGTPTTRSGYGIADAEPTISTGTTSEYWRGDKTWQTIDHGSLSGLGDNDHTQYELVANKNIAGGYAGLTESTLIAAPQLGSGTPTSANYLRGDRSWSTITYTDVGAAPATGSSFITTLGTISTGVWQGSVIGPAYLGTGVRDGTKYLRDDGTWQAVAAGTEVIPYAEVPSGTVDGVNFTFTLAHTPSSSLGVIVVLDGVTQYNGVDYTVSGSTITFIAAPAVSSTIFAYYGVVSATPGRAALVKTATKTTNYTALITDDVIPVDCTGGNVTITLPAISGVTNSITIVRIDMAISNTCTIDPDGSETIMSETTTTLAGNSSYTLLPVGTDWRIL